MKAFLKIISNVKYFVSTASKTQKNCPWISKTRKKSNRRKEPTKKFRKQDRESLAASGKGSWYNQAEQWPELAESSSPASASGKKILGTFATDSGESGNTQVVDLLISSASATVNGEDNLTEPNSQTQTEELIPPNQLQIVDPQIVGDALESAAVCRDCKKSGLQLLEKSKSRYGLGTKLILKCKNWSCHSHNFPTQFNTSQKNWKFFEINRPRSAFRFTCLKR